MFNKKRKGLSGIALSALIFMGSFSGMYVPAQNAYATVEDYHTWRQTDPRWADIQIGNTTVGKSGCLITAISMMAVHSGSADAETFNPGVFANELNALSSIDASGSMYWFGIGRVLPLVSIVENVDFQCSDQAGKAQQMRSAMEEGYYVICNVGGHWVFVEDITENNDVYMIDPARDDVLMFDTYNNSNITYYQTFKGKNPPSLSYADSGNASAVTTSFTTTVETTTTTTTTEEVTTTTTTVATTAPDTEPANDISQTTVEKNSSEFYYAGGETTCIYTSAGELITEITTGNIVNVQRVENNMGLVTINGIEGWIDMTDMVFYSDWRRAMRGDINRDGKIDLYDLTLINEYLKSLKYLPEGVSILSQSEIESADINGDGVVDTGDVLEYLSIICG